MISKASVKPSEQEQAPKPQPAKVDQSTVKKVREDREKVVEEKQVVKK
jgi:hypothetical protein